MSDNVRGAHWIRAALQVNPYAYQGKTAPSTTFASERDYNKALLDECENLGISLIAVTDHWCVDTAKELITAANTRGVVALPGFEANSSEGIHLLVIFEEGTKATTVNAAIGACGVEPSSRNGTTGDSFRQILEKMTAKGALVIPAHVNVPNSGMLTGRSGQPLVEMVKNPSLHVLAITPGQPDGTDQAKIVKGTKPYDRKHPLAIIHADDVTHPDQLKTVGASTWFKVSGSRAESLKLAVRTPETRVALSDPTGQPRASIRQISWTGGFLDGVTLPISSDLTTLIGGRGTGKSTVVESLRYALGLTPIGEDATRDHKAIVEKVLRSGTIVKVEVEAVSPTPHRYTIERIVPNPPVVRDASGTATNQRPEDVAGPVEVFGQHELAELASSPERVAEMLRRFAGGNGVDPQYQEVREKLADNRKQLQRGESSFATLQNELADIPRLEEQVEQYKKTDVAARLEALQRLAKEESLFKEGGQRVSAVAEVIQSLGDSELETTLLALYDGVEDSPRHETLERVSAATSKLAARLKELAGEARKAITEAESAISGAQEEWESSVQDQRDGHAEVLRKLHDEGLEPDKYLDTSKALDALKAKQPRLARQVEKLERLKKDRDSLLGQLASQEREQVEALHDAVRAANAATGCVVVVQPIAAPDRSNITEVIIKHTTGPRPQMMAAVAADDFSPRSFVKAVRSGDAELAKLGIKGAQAANLRAAGEPLLRRVSRINGRSRP